ncbi:hypothetical protein GQ457_09G007950 [Hibiscus cannabinus]
MEGQWHTITQGQRITMKKSYVTHPYLQSSRFAERNVDVSEEDRGVTEKKAAAGPLNKPERMPSVDINESAEAFIQKFRHQLLLQRLESIENYQQMLARVGEQLHISIMNPSVSWKNNCSTIARPHATRSRITMKKSSVTHPYQTSRFAERNVDISEEDGGVTEKKAAAALRNKPERMPSVDINESAEAFIQKFRHQLLLQRLESIENYQQMLARDVGNLVLLILSFDVLLEDLVFGFS